MNALVISTRAFLCFELNWTITGLLMNVLTNVTHYPIMLQLNGSYINLRPNESIDYMSVVVADVTNPLYNYDKIQDYIDNGILMKVNKYGEPDGMPVHYGTFIVYGTYLELNKHEIIEDNV